MNTIPRAAATADTVPATTAVTAAADAPGSPDSHFPLPDRRAGRRRAAPGTWRGCGLAALVAAAPLAHAVVVNDAVGDYVPGFTGSRAGDLDVVSSFVTYNVAKDTFVFSGTMNADIGTSAGGFYVWGVNRGTGVASFAANGFGGVLFDAVVIFNADGSGRVTGNNPTTFGAGTAKVIGSTIVGEIGGQFLPSTGFAKTAYTWNLWPRDGTAPAGFGQISDFAPDNSNQLVTVIGAVPEPASVALLLAGLAAIGWQRRRRGQA